MNKRVIKLTVFSLLMILCFLAGRYTKKQSVVSKFVKGRTVTDSVMVPAPFEIHDTITLAEAYNKIFPDKSTSDTLRFESVVMTKQDTTKVLSDWQLKREYKLNIFSNDTLGTLTVNSTVQYNRMQHIDYSYTPIIKEIITKEPKITPFVGGGVSNVGYNLTLGAFYKSQGVQLGYLQDIKNSKGITFINYLIKF